MKFYKLVKNNELDEEKKKWKKTLEESIDTLELKKPEPLFEEEKKYKKWNAINSIPINTFDRVTKT